MSGSAPGIHGILAQRLLPALLLPLPRASSLRGLRGISTDEEKQRIALLGGAEGA